MSQFAHDVDCALLAIGELRRGRKNPFAPPGRVPGGTSLFTFNIGQITLDYVAEDSKLRFRDGSWVRLFEVWTEE